ncbi:hypothetical protein [Mycobacterium intracellulare]|uniref:hypothetical protein n=1 Tax=Mycobacterium intracellulare TaxID=1767 RepID=UPI0034D20ECC
MSSADQADLAVQSGPKTSLALTPQHGGPGTQVTITAMGYGPCIDPPAELRAALVGSPVFSLQWGRTTVDNVQTTNEGRNVAARYTVPDGVSAGDVSVTVTVSCSFELKVGSRGESKAGPKVVHNEETFTVMAPKKDPALTLDTPAGHRGAQIQASGTDSRADRVKV